MDESMMEDSPVSSGASKIVVGIVGAVGVAAGFLAGAVFSGRKDRKHLEAVNQEVEDLKAKVEAATAAPAKKVGA